MTPNGGAERWRLAGLPGARGIAAWADILAVTHLAFDVRATFRTPGTFQGTVTRRRFGELALVDCAASPFLGDRSLAVMGDHPEEIVGFQFVRKGVELVRESRREIALTAGDVVLWDGLQPTQVEVVEPFVKRTLIFPRERVLAVCPRLADLKALPPMDHNGAAALLVRYLNALAAELPGLDATARGAAADAALELLRAAVEPAVPTSRDARRAAHARRGAPLRPGPPARPGARPRGDRPRPRDLRPRAARAVRGHRRVGRGLVRRERLARCYEDLGLPSGGSVTEIAFRWGFRDAAHFSRVFKREFERHAERGPPRRARGPRRRRGRTDRQRIRRCHTSPRPDAALASPRDGGSDGGQGGPRHGRGERHRPRLRDPLRARRARRSSSPTSSAPAPAARRPCARSRRRAASADVLRRATSRRPRTARRSSRDVVERHGRLDYAHNNAGIGVHKLLADTDDEDFDRVIAVNLRGTFLGMKHQIRQMLQNGGGAIVNTSSNAGLRAVRLLSAYTASKHGINGLTKNAAVEYANDGIRVNCVCPGAIMTPLMFNESPERQERDPPPAGDDALRRAARGGRRGRLAVLRRRLVRHRDRDAGGRRVGRRLVAQIHSTNRQEARRAQARHPGAPR